MTVTEYEDRRFRIIDAFHSALVVVRSTDYGSDAAMRATHEAFAVAKVEGWEWSADQDFVDWCLKATEEETLAEGMRRALLHRPSYAGFVEFLEFLDTNGMRSSSDPCSYEGCDGDCPSDAHEPDRSAS